MRGSGVFPRSGQHGYFLLLTGSNLNIKVGQWICPNDPDQEQCNSLSGHALRVACLAAAKKVTELLRTEGLLTEEEVEVLSSEPVPLAATR